jgi:hypothetical protein
LPVFASSNPSPPPELAPGRVQQPGVVSAEDRTTIPPPMRREALLVDDPQAPPPRKTLERVAQSGSGSDDLSTTQPRMLRVDDAATTQPRFARSGNEDQPVAGASDVGDVTSPSVPLVIHPRGKPGGFIPPVQDSPWGKDLASRIDSALEDDFGTETPVSAPTRAELQALLGTAPDPTRKQSFEEIERLHRASPGIDNRGRNPHPTEEVDPDDIEAAIELAPPARRHTIGVAKKKPGE